MNRATICPACGHALDEIGRQMHNSKHTPSIFVIIWRCSGCKAEVKTEYRLQLISHSVE